MRKHILIVDDEPGFRYGAAVALKNAGHCVSLAADGEEAYAMVLRENTFDLLLVDLQMPRMPGAELIDVIRDEAIATPIVVISACADPDQVDELLKKGCAAFIDKRVDPQEFVKRVEMILKNHTEKNLRE